MGGYVGCEEETRNAYKILVGKGRKERPHRTPSCKSENNIITEIKEV